MRAGTAAIGIARAGGNSIKFSARNSGAKNFSDGAKSGLFGSSIYDVSDILKVILPSSAATLPQQDGSSII